MCRDPESVQRVGSGWQVLRRRILHPRSLKCGVGVNTTKDQIKKKDWIKYTRDSSCEFFVGLRRQREERKKGRRWRDERRVAYS